jgi:predicted Fe-Mo cluster-binding NifX family protein
MYIYNNVMIRETIKNRFSTRNFLIETMSSQLVVGKKLKIFQLMISHAANAAIYEKTPSKTNVLNAEFLKQYKGDGNEVKGKLLSLLDKDDPRFRHLW